MSVSLARSSHSDAGLAAAAGRASTAPPAVPANDSQALPSFEDELVRCLPALGRRALQLTRSPVEAEDLLQDTAARALRFRDGYSRGSHLRAWLDRIMTRLFVSRLRRRQREASTLERLGSDPCAWLQPEPIAPAERLSPPVSGALEALPEKFAEVVCLVDLHEHSYRDAALRIGVPVGTVMSRLWRGRRMLASALREPPERDEPRARAA